MFSYVNTVKYMLQLILYCLIKTWQILKSFDLEFGWNLSVRTLNVISLTRVLHKPPNTQVWGGPMRF